MKEVFLERRSTPLRAGAVKAQEPKRDGEKKDQ